MKNKITAEYLKYRSLFIPPLYGHIRAWKRLIKQKAESADEVIQMGNFINLNVCDNEAGDVRKANTKLIKLMELWRVDDDRWKTLIGPNELITLNSEDSPWITDGAHQALRDGWFARNPFFKVAAVSKGRLVTPAGLTHGEWLKIGAPQTAFEAAARLNEKYCRKLYLGPCLKMGDSINFSANPIFAHPVAEVYPSWTVTGDVMPFDQIHTMENMKTSPDKVLSSMDYRVDERIGLIKGLPYGAVFQCNGGYFLGIDDIVHDIIKKFVISDMVVYSEICNIPEEIAYENVENLRRTVELEGRNSYEVSQEENGEKDS